LKQGSGPDASACTPRSCSQLVGPGSATTATNPVVCRLGRLKPDRRHARVCAELLRITEGLTHLGLRGGPADPGVSILGEPPIGFTRLGRAGSALCLAVLIAGRKTVCLGETAEQVRGFQWGRARARAEGSLAARSRKRLCVRAGAGDLFAIRATRVRDHGGRHLGGGRGRAGRRTLDRRSFVWIASTSKH
jgi:hypothetical protein